MKTGSKKAFETINRRALQRWMRILASLRTGDPPAGWMLPRSAWRPNAQNFAKAFECNARTIQRDLAAMRDIDYQIDYDESSHTLEWTNLRGQEPLPLMKSSENEVLALLSAFAISGSVLDAATAKHLGTFLRKLEEHIPDGWLHPVEVVQNALAYKPTHHPPADPRLWTRLLHAIINQQGITIGYDRAYDHPKPDQKHLLPIHLASIEGVWYLYAFDAKNPRADLPQFYRLSRMTSLRIRKTLRTPDVVDLSKIREKLQGGFGPWQGYDPMSFRFRISGTAIRLIKERVWPPGHRFIQQDDGSHLLEFQSTGGIQGLKIFVLSWLEHIEVLEPQSLRDEIARVTAAAADRHQAPG